MRTTATPEIQARTVISFPAVTKNVNRRLVKRIVDTILSAANHPQNPQHIAEIVASWERAKCNLRVWLSESPAIASEVGKKLEDWRVRIEVHPDGKPGPLFIGAFGFDEENSEKRANTDKSFAYDLFTVFLIAAAPLTEIGRCDRCNEFFWNRWGHLNKRFCGRKCAQLQTASEAQSERLAEERRDKNKEIKKAIRAFIRKKPTTPDWKRWVAERAGATRYYVTSALNRGQRGETDALVLTKKQRDFFARLEAR